MAGLNSSRRPRSAGLNPGTPGKIDLNGASGKRFPAAPLKRHSGEQGRREFHLGGDWESKGPAVQIRLGVVVVDFDGGETLRLILAHNGGN